MADETQSTENTQETTTETPVTDTSGSTDNTATIDTTSTTTEDSSGTTTDTTPTPIQAVKWQAILQGGSKLTGGTGDPSDVNVSAVPAPLVQLFTVSGTESSDTLYLVNQKEEWFRGGQPFTPSFPLAYTLADGSSLTISRNSETAGDLTYTQA